MIIDNVKEVDCFRGAYGVMEYENVKQVVVGEQDGAMIITTKDGTEVILVNMPCRIKK